MRPQDQQDEHATTPSKDHRMFGQPLSRRAVVRAGVAGAAGITAAGLLRSAGATPTHGNAFRAPALLRQAAEEG